MPTTITPNLIYEGSFGFEIFITINKPLSADSIYKLFIEGPGDIQTTYQFSSSTDFVDETNGVLSYVTQDGAFPIKGNYMLQISEERQTPNPMRLFSTLIQVPVHDAIPVE